MTVNFLVTGVLLLVFAAGVRVMASGRTGRSGDTGGDRGPGIGLLLAGIFPTQPLFGYPPGTPEGMAIDVTPASLAPISSARSCSSSASSRPRCRLRCVRGAAVPRAGRLDRSPSPRWCSCPSAPRAADRPVNSSSRTSAASCNASHSSPAWAGSLRSRCWQSTDHHVRQISRTEARRIAIRAQLLDADRPRDLLDVVDRLTFLQLDPTAVIAPAADLVAWSRLGDRYDPAQLTTALERDRTLFEHKAQPTLVEAPIVMIRPMADLPLFLAEMPEMPPPRFGNARAFLKANDAFRRRILDQLARRRTAHLARDPRHERDSVAVERLDPGAQRRADARAARLAGRGGRLGTTGSRARSGISPSGCSRPA